MAVGGLVVGPFVAGRLVGVCGIGTCGVDSEVPLTTGGAVVVGLVVGPFVAGGLCVTVGLVGVVDVEASVVDVASPLDDTLDE